LYGSLNIIRAIRWAGHEARMEDIHTKIGFEGLDSAASVLGPVAECREYGKRRRISRLTERLSASL